MVPLLDTDATVAFEKEFIKRTGADLQSLAANAAIVRSAFLPLMPEARSIIVEYARGPGFSDIQRLEISLAPSNIQPQGPNASTKGGSESSTNGMPSQGTTTARPVTDLKEAQIILKRLGFNVGAPDGVMGRRTAVALREFQLQVGLKPTGNLDLETARLLATK